MARFNRKTALAALRKSAGYWDRWITTREWIKDMVRIEPTVMRKVARMTFGAMGSWMERGSDNVSGVCGCLVGSCAIALVEARNSFEPSAGGSMFVRTTGDDLGEKIGAPQAVAELVRKEFREHMAEAADEAGMAAYAVAEFFREDGDEWEGVALIKSEILFQLQARTRRLRAAKARRK